MKKKTILIAADSVSNLEKKIQEFINDNNAEIFNVKYNNMSGFFGVLTRSFNPMYSAKIIYQIKIL